MRGQGVFLKIMVNNKATYSGVLGVVLSRFRQRKGMEQAEMARKMGLTQASYSRLEGGKSSFTVDQLYQAANALEVSSSILIEELNQYSAHLSSDGITVEPQVRGNSKQASNGNGVGTFVAGAALGAILLGILSKK